MSPHETSCLFCLLNLYSWNYLGLMAWMMDIFQELLTKHFLHLDFVPCRSERWKILVKNWLYKTAIEKPWLLLLLQNNAKTQVVPSKTIQTNAILASEITRAASLIGLCLLRLCNLIVTRISMIMLANIIAATGATTLM